MESTYFRNCTKRSFVDFNAEGHFEGHTCIHSMDEFLHSYSMHLVTQ